MKFTIALIEDNPEVRFFLYKLLSECKEFEVTVYASPCEYTMKGEWANLVVSDWRFESMTLGPFIGVIDPKRLIVISGSRKDLKIDCLAVYDKTIGLKNIVSAVKLTAHTLSLSLAS